MTAHGLLHPVVIIKWSENAILPSRRKHQAESVRPLVIVGASRSLEQAVETADFAIMQEKTPVPRSAWKSTSVPLDRARRRRQGCGCLAIKSHLENCLMKNSPRVGITQTAAEEARCLSCCKSMYRGHAGTIVTLCRSGKTPVVQTRICRGTCAGKDPVWRVPSWLENGGSSDIITGIAGKDGQHHQFRQSGVTGRHIMQNKVTASYRRNACANLPHEAEVDSS